MQRHKHTNTQMQTHKYTNTEWLQKALGACNSLYWVPAALTSLLNVGVGMSACLETHRTMLMMMMTLSCHTALLHHHHQRHHHHIPCLLSVLKQDGTSRGLWLLTMLSNEVSCTLHCKHHHKHHHHYGGYVDLKSPESKSLKTKAMYSIEVQCTVLVQCWVKGMVT